MNDKKPALPENLTLNQDQPLLPISAVAEILKVHQRTLRIYDAENILVPSRTPKNRRLYSLNDMEKGKFIQYLTRDLGINLIGVKIIFLLLSELKISPDKYIEHIGEIAKNIGLSSEAQQKNRRKYSKRGRKSQEK